MLWWIVQ